MLADGLLKGCVNLLEPVLQDIGEPDQDGDGQPAELKAIDQALEVNAPVGILGGMDLEMTVLVD